MNIFLHENCALHVAGHSDARSWKAFFHSAQRICPTSSDTEAAFVRVHRCRKSASPSPVTSGVLFLQLTLPRTLPLCCICVHLLSSCVAVNFLSPDFVTVIFCYACSFLVLLNLLQQINSPNTMLYVYVLKGTFPMFNGFLIIILR